LDADHLVIGGEDVFPDEAGVVMVIVVMGGVGAHGSGGRRWLIQKVESEWQKMRGQLFKFGIILKNWTMTVGLGRERR
jgi:hypothetical protein